MSRIAALALPLALVLGCAAAPPPAAAPQPESPALPAPMSDSKADPARSPTLGAGAAPATPSAASAAPAPPPPPQPGRATVAAEAPLLGGITQGDVLALVQKNADAFYRCYTLGAGTSKGYRAKVTVKATVGPTGAVNDVLVINSTAKNPRVDACVADTFKNLTFVRAKGSGTTTFTFPLSFDGLEQVQ